MPDYDQSHESRRVAGAKVGSVGPTPTTSNIKKRMAIMQEEVNNVETSISNLLQCISPILTPPDPLLTETATTKPACDQSELGHTLESVSDRLAQMNHQIRLAISNIEL